MDSNFLYKDECFLIIGAAMEVHNQLGPGFLEPVYQEALKWEFEDRRIPSGREVHLNIHYKDRVLEKKYIADFLCYDDIIIELKACEKLAPEHTAQVLNYLKATGKQLGLLINFGAHSLDFKRVILK